MSIGTLRVNSHIMQPDMVIIRKEFYEKKETCDFQSSSGSIGEELELEPGDVLAEINHQPVEDVFDYRYLLNDEYIELLIEKANGEIWELEVEKDYDEDLGIEFENGLMDDYRSCSNHCMFCFIDQMPPGMRETLYFKTMIPDFLFCRVTM